MEEKIIDVLNKLRPYLNSDGGDLEFVKYEDYIVYIKLFGACCGCAHRNETIKGGLLRALQAEIPEIKDIVIVE